MSQLTSEPTPLPGWKRWLPAILVAVGFLPLMYWHIGGLLERPHYQFLYLLPITLWLLYLTANPVPTTPVSSSEIIPGTVLMGLALAGLIYAAWVWSPWIAAVCFLVAGFGAILSVSGWRGIRNWFPTWVFCWILIPLPYGMDEDLIVYLRGITTRLSSSVLDQIGLLHNSYANVIELPGKPLFIADACSGIQSLYVLIAAALFLAMWLRRGIMHTSALLMSTLVLVLVQNVTRIVMVAVLWDKGYDFSTGANHELLGLGLFCVSLLLMTSTDQLLLFLLPTRIPSLLKWSYEKLSGEGREKKRRQTTLAPVRLTTMAMVVAAIFPVIGVAQLFRLPETRPNFATALYDDFELPELDENVLPEMIGPFERQSYNAVTRVPGDPLGQASQMWQYSDGSTSVVMSIDYPYAGIHDLCECYSAIGWSVPDRQIVSVKTLEPKIQHVDGPIAVARLKRDLYGHAMLLFNLTDRLGTTDVIIKDLARGDAQERANRRFQSFQEKDGENKPIKAPPYIQFQLFARTTQPATELQEQQLIQMFFEAKNILRQQLAKKEVE